MTDVLRIVFHCFWHWAGAAFLLTIVVNGIVSIIRVALREPDRSKGEWARVESIP